MASAASAIANGGILYEPHVVRALIVNNERRPTPVKALHRVISAETAATMTSILEAVVEEGTAKAARIPGYTIAGKTGTAEKLIKLPGYEYSTYFDQAWWCGYGPTEAPTIVVCAVIENGGHGGTAAAPAALTVFEAYFGERGVITEHASD